LSVVRKTLFDLESQLENGHSEESGTSDVSSIQTTKSDMDIRLHTFHGFFPIVHPLHANTSITPWQALARAVYISIAKARSPYFPVVRQSPVEQSSSSSFSSSPHGSLKLSRPGEEQKVNYTLKWLPATGAEVQLADGSSGYFNNLPLVQESKTQYLKASGELVAQVHLNAYEQKKADIYDKERRGRMEILKRMIVSSPGHSSSHSPVGGTYPGGLSPVGGGSYSGIWRRQSSSSGVRQTDETSMASLVSNVLLSLDFPLLSSPWILFESFRESGVEGVAAISPAIVTAFLKGPACASFRSSLPLSIVQTPLKSKTTLITLLKYLKIRHYQDGTSFIDQEAWLQSLEGLPLNLTQDDVLRGFSTQDPTFLTAHTELIPSAPQAFTARSLRYAIFNDVDASLVPVFRHFTISALASLLDEHLAPELKQSELQFLPWDSK
jgi:hypothetical protein